MDAMIADYIYVWADGTWSETLEGMQHMSDDYTVVNVYEHELYEEAADRFARSIGAY